MSFCEKVKYAREKLVLSQTEFANKLGVSFASVNRWENGVRVPTYALQRKFYEFCREHGIYFDDKENIFNED